MDRSYTLGETLVRIENVHKSYGDNVILKNVDAEIKNIKRPAPHTQGQVVGFLGPSGIGKTQLSLILAGLIKPTNGRVLIGKNGTPVKHGLVGMVFQNSQVYEYMTVYQCLMEGARLLPKGVRKARVKELMDRFGLMPIARLYTDPETNQISGGQRQRVAIVQQLLCSEHYIIMDEPFSGLDPGMKFKACEFIQQVAASDELNTFIIVTHDVHSAVAIADTIWIMGRDRDAGGNIIPGARIVKTYNLIDEGLAWHSEIADMPEYHKLVAEIDGMFRRDEL